MLKQIPIAEAPGKTLNRVVSDSHGFTLVYDDGTFSHVYAETEGELTDLDPRDRSYRIRAGIMTQEEYGAEEAVYLAERKERERKILEAQEARDNEMRVWTQEQWDEWLRPTHIYTRNLTQ